MAPPEDRELSEALDDLACVSVILEAISRTASTNRNVYELQQLARIKEKALSIRQRAQQRIQRRNERLKQ